MLNPVFGQGVPNSGIGVPNAAPTIAGAGTIGSVLSNGQYLIYNNVPGVNVLTVDNLNANGYAAYTAMGPDSQYPSTVFQANGHYEHFAFGYGSGLTLNGLAGYNYLESSRYDTANNADIPPSRLAIQQTGGVAQSPVLINAGLTMGLATATINTCVSCGGVWPANGSYLTQLSVGTIFLSPGTFIMSGGGTATATLNQPALATNGFVPVTVGAPTYAQYTTMLYTEQGPIEFFTWANGAGANPVSPYLVFDRQFGRFGMNLGTGALPTNTMDVVGQGTFGPDATQASRRIGTYDLNIIDAGTNFIKLFKDGVDQLNIQWNATPSRIDFVEANGSTVPLSLYMDGTATAKMAGPIINTGITADTAHTDTSVCQDTTSHQFYSGTGTVGICLGTSSARYKHGIENLDVGLPEVLKLRPVKYFLNEDHGDPTKLMYGFTAEDADSVMPKLVGRDTEDRPNTFDYLGVVPALVRAIQEMQGEIDALRSHN